jgi:teichoic acid transport system permease protein
MDVRSGGSAPRPPDGFIEIGARQPLGPYLRQLWSRRDFILQVPLGQLRAQTQSTLLGSVWHLLNPILNAALYYLIFGVLFAARGTVDNYAAFLLVGIFTFTYLSRSIQAGGQSVTGNVGLIAQINFPRAALPISATIAETISHGFAIGAMLAILLVLGEVAVVSWLLVVPITMLQMCFVLGLTMIFARIVFQYRDVEKLMPHGLRFWLYLSGIFFSIDRVEQALGSENPLVSVFAYNPAYVFISLMRGALLAGHELRTSQWVAAALWSVGTLLGGLYYFRARETSYGHG